MVDFLVRFDSTEFDAADSGGPMLPMVPVEAQAVQVNASLVEKEIGLDSKSRDETAFAGHAGTVDMAMMLPGPFFLTTCACVRSWRIWIA